MLTMQLLPRLLVLGIILAELNGCAPTATPPSAPPATAFPTPTEMPKAAGTEWHLVVISESSGWGLGEAFAKQIEKDVGVRVVLHDFAIGDLSAGEVLQVLQTGKGSTSRLEELPAALRRADVVVMWGNPMLSVDDATAGSIISCFGSSAPAPCTPKAFQKYTADLEAIWAKVFELRAGQPTILRAIDVASPFVADWKKYQTFEACTGCFECVSNALRQAAEAYHIPFLSRYDAFNGVDHDQDPKQQGYVGSDGIHPNDLAQQRSAELLAKLGYDPVPPPSK
jgi:hypothetical protein